MSTFNVAVIETMTTLDTVISYFFIASAIISCVGIIFAVAGNMQTGLGTVMDQFFSAEKTGKRDETEANRLDAIKSKGAEVIESSILSKDDISYLTSLLKKHGSNDVDAFICLGWTLLYFVLAVHLLKEYPSWWTILLMGIFHVRGFIIFHDACHLSFFNGTRKNKLLAQAMSAFIPQNYSDWTASHNYHHSHLGDTSHIDLSLTIWFNQKEYEDMPKLVRIAFRIIRDPLLLPLILSAWVFILFPFIKSPYETICNRLCFYVPFCCMFGARTSFLYLVASWVGGMIGLQLFHLQHQCNTPYRVNHEKHSMWDAGIIGSTHLLVPWPLTFMTLGIEFHHIHHASTRVPCYHLSDCHAEGESRFGLGWSKVSVNRVGFKRAFLSTFHCLFEDSKVETEGKPLPKFKSFEPYQSWGLHDE